MKKKTIIAFMAAIVLSICTPLSADAALGGMHGAGNCFTTDCKGQGCGHGQGQGQGRRQGQCQFTDSNGDGICDNYKDADGDGICDNYKDADGDGICDRNSCNSNGKNNTAGIPKSITLKRGKSKTLRPSTSQMASSGRITYRSSNKAVAAVNKKGKVTGKQKGRTIISVKSGTKTIKCKVKVK